MRGGGCRTAAAGGSDGNGGGAGSGSGNQGGNKVVVTTIEELDIDHNSSTASLMVMDHHRHGSDHSLRGSSGGLRSSASTSTGLTVAVKNNPDLVPFIQQQQSKLLTVKSRVEARVTIQKIKSLGVLQTKTCH